MDHGFDPSSKRLAALLPGWACFWLLGWLGSWSIRWAGLGLAFLLITGHVVAREFSRGDEDDERREPTEPGRIRAA